MNQVHRDTPPLVRHMAMPPPAESGAPKGAGLNTARQHIWQVDRQDGEAGDDRMLVLARPLHETEWAMIRAFVRKTDRDDLHMRFGQSIDFRDDATLKRFFGISGESGELLCRLDDAGDIVGILHRVLVSPFEAEVALIVRSDRKRTGIGQRLLQAALSRGARQHLKTLRAQILRDNVPMLRLARKVGLTPVKSAGFAVEVEFVLGRMSGVAPAPPPAVADFGER